jgi:TRAP-type C4-dicarboxylate transport system substrate-binding protein
MRNKKTEKTSMLSVVMLIAFVALFVLCLSPSPGSCADKPIELRFTSIVNSLHSDFKAFQRFGDEVGKRTGGKVHITVYPSGTLNPPMETYNAIKTGMAQMGCAAVGYSGPILPLNHLFGDALRGLSTSTEAAKAYTTALKTVPEMLAEYEGMHIVYVFSTVPLSIGTAKKPIHKMEDFKGAVMRFPPGMETIARAWGASPIAVPIGDIYVALQKGTINGFMGGAEMLKSMRLAELTKYLTSAEMSYGMNYVAVNQKVWDSFPPDVKKVFDDLADWGQSMTLEHVDQAEKEAITYAKSQGVQEIVIDKAELARLHAAVKPVFEKRAADLEARGKAGKKVLAAVERLSGK